jgi:hypothetical protein
MPESGESGVSGESGESEEYGESELWVDEAECDVWEEYSDALVEVEA